MSNIVSSSINFPVICMDSWTHGLYMFRFLPESSDGVVGPLSGGRKMALASGTPAKSKKMTVASVLKQIESEKIRWIDLQFVDVLGSLQHITIPSTSLGSEEFKRGVGKLDGSSIKGFKEIHESDMLMNPDPSTFAVLPWYEGEHKTARFFVDVYEGGSHERFTRDSRFMAQRAAQFAAEQGFDTTYWGPEIEFFVFDGIRLLPSADAARNPWSGAGYEIISREAPWSDSGGKEFPIRFKEGYYPAPPVDSLQDYRNEACRVLIESFGMTLDAHHHEVATAGQCEIDMRYDELVPPARPRLRGARVHRLVQTQPEREHPDPDVLPGDRGREAHRVSDAGPGVQSVPVLRRDAVRRPRRRQEEDRSGQPRRRGPVPSQREQAQGIRRPRAAGIPEGVHRAPADRLHVPHDGLPAGPPRQVRGAEARRAPADLAAALAVRVLPVHGRLKQAGLGSLTPLQRTAVVSGELAE